MRISDWSSDGCSSDLHNHINTRLRLVARQLRHIRRIVSRRGPLVEHLVDQAEFLGFVRRHELVAIHRLLDLLERLARIFGVEFVHPRADTQDRSEEHTSELQSLMRISYAVFCLKNKNTQ